MKPTTQVRNRRLRAAAAERPRETERSSLPDYLRSFAFQQKTPTSLENCATWSSRLPDVNTPLSHLLTNRNRVAALERVRPNELKMFLSSEQLQHLIHFHQFSSAVGTRNACPRCIIPTP
jgi:hypothetical protein